MKSTHAIKVEVYATTDGQLPFIKWLDYLRPFMSCVRIVGATRVVARRSALQRFITNSFCGTTMTRGGHNKDRHPDGQPRGLPLQNRPSPSLKGT